MMVVITAKVGVADRVRVLQRVCTDLLVVQEYSELVLNCEASGDDVGYSVAAIFCKHFGLSDDHCSLYHNGLVVNSAYLKQVSRSRLIRLAVWQPARPDCHPPPGSEIYWYGSFRFTGETQGP